MKRKFARLSLLVLPIVLVFLLSGNAAASPSFPVTQMVATYCSAGPAERSWFADNTHHGRNAIYTSIIESDYPELVYDGTAYPNWNINIKTMQGVGWGTFQNYIPGSSDGWIGIYNSEMHMAWPLVIMAPQEEPLWLNDGRVVGHGTGSFHGMQMKFEYHQHVMVFDEEPSEYPCVTGQTIDGKYFVLQQEMTGYIIGMSDN